MKLRCSLVLTVLLTLTGCSDADDPPCANGGDGEWVEVAWSGNPWLVPLVDGRLARIGGLDSSSPASDIWDPETDEVTPMSRPPAQAGAYPVGLSDGRILFAGGEEEHDVLIYDATTDTWEATAPMIAGTQQHYSPALLADGRVFFAGNQRAQPVVFDPQNETWTLLPNIPNDFHHNVTALTDGRVLVSGETYGYPGPAPQDSAAPSWRIAYVLDDDDTWRRVTDEASGRTIEPLDDGTALIVDGHSARVLTPDNGHVRTVAPPLVRRAGAQSAMLQDGRVLLFTGGQWGDDIRDSDPILYSAEIYDPSEDRWTCAARVPLAEGQYFAQYVGMTASGRVIAATSSTDFGLMYVP